MIVKTRLTKRGFTLIETLVAVMILATSIAGPLSIASRSLNVALVSKDQITAFFLAQDAVEYVRYVRDTNRLLGADWLTGAGGISAGINLTPCLDAAGCYVDTTGNSQAIPAVCTGTCPLMYYNTTGSLFTYTVTGNSRTFFTRQILLTHITPTDPRTEERLTVIVSWNDVPGGPTRSVIIYENLFAWQ